MQNVTIESTATGVQSMRCADTRTSSCHQGTHQKHVCEMIVLILREVAVSGVWLRPTSASANLLDSNLLACCQYQQECVEFVKVHRFGVEQLEVLRSWRGTCWSSWSVLILKTDRRDEAATSLFVDLPNAYEKILAHCCLEEDSLLLFSAKSS